MLQLFDKETLRKTTQPILALTGVLLMGGFGYHLIEGWTLFDAIYMTAITLSTVGFGEVHPLSTTGKVFTLFLLISGVLAYGYAINVLVQVMMQFRYGDNWIRFRMNKKIQSMEGHYIICGGGRMAIAIGRELERAGKPFLVIDQNPECEVLKHRVNWPILERDALIEENLTQARIEHAAGLASVLPTDADNLFVVLSARRLNPNLVIESRITTESTRSKMLQAGANKVVSPYTVGGQKIARSFLNPETSDFLTLGSGETMYELGLVIHRVRADDPYCGKSIRESDFRNKGYIVIGIRREDDTVLFGPGASFVFQAGEEVLLLAGSEAW